MPSPALRLKGYWFDTGRRIEDTQDCKGRHVVYDDIFRINRFGLHVFEIGVLKLGASGIKVLGLNINPDDDGLNLKNPKFWHWSLSKIKPAAKK